MAPTLTSVAQAHRIAKRRLPRSVYWFIEGGNEVEVTLRHNVSAFEEIALVPRIGVETSPRDLSTTILGHRIELPVLIGPAGWIRLADRGGELAAARAAREMGTGLGLSTLASYPVEDVAAANDFTIFQLYFTGDRAAMEASVARARRAGCAALMLTMDARPRGIVRDRKLVNAATPTKVDLRTALRYGPEMVLRPRWLAAFLRDGLELSVPNVLRPDGTQMSVGEASVALSATVQPVWEDIPWIKDVFGGPVIVKGVLTAEDAKRAVQAGAEAVVVSNHGGNGLDGVVPTIHALPEIAAAVGDQVHVLVDGGIRRGSDVVKALALGAEAVLIGRPYIWGLAAAGQQGATDVLRVLRAGIDATLAALGCQSIEDLDPSHVVVPARCACHRASPRG